MIEKERKQIMNKFAQNYGFSSMQELKNNIKPADVIDTQGLHGPQTTNH